MKNDSLKQIVATMMNEENDRHAKILNDLNSRINFEKYNLKDTIERLQLIHDTKIKTLEEVYEKIK